MIDFTCTRLENGNLKLTLNEEGREWLSDVMADKHFFFWTALSDLFESYACNGSYTPFDAGDGDPFVGLTSAPCIAEAMDYPDDGRRVIEGDFWYFDRYMIDDPLEELRDNGETIFQLAKEEG